MQIEELCLAFRRSAKDKFNAEREGFAHAWKKLKLKNDAKHERETEKFVCLEID